MLQAPLSWWDGTPKGRITSRFSTDLGLVDTQLGFVLDNAMQLFLSLVALCAIVAFVVPPMSVLIVFCAVLFGLLFHVFDLSNTQIKRMAHHAVSPMMSTLAECSQMQRVATLLGTEDYFISRNKTNTNFYSTLNYATGTLMHLAKLAASWLAVGVTAGASAWVLFVDRSNSDKAAIAMTYAVTIPYFLGMGCTVLTVVKALFTGLERLLEYKALPQEPEWHMINDPDTSAWPTKGKIEFRQVELRYKPELPKALRGVTFTIPGGKRAGIVGRTGSGKSSLVACLFRLHEICAGTVLLDDRDTSKLGLQCLRRTITVVPQDPVLMEGSVKTNLDPFSTVEQDVLKRAVQKAELAADETATDIVLARNVEGGGSNLSCGERQLLCLARAVISGPRVLVMDEPTSSTDPETDAKLQSMVRSEFACTTLCIAHRIRTVADSDLLLVMHDGEVLEFGTPKDLYLQPSGHFRGLCESSGVNLHSIAI